MKRTLLVSMAAAAMVSAHSWLECVDHDNSEILEWMKGNSTFVPPVIIDPAMPWFSHLCKAWPRNKKNPGNWIDESTFYTWNIGANSWDGGNFHPADTHACHPDQRSPTYQDNAPMATAAPGSMLRLRFGGNGHTRGGNVGGDPGTVAVYWKGAPEAEITDISEFTDANKIAEGGFAANSFSYPADPNVKSPVDGLVDKGNWLEMTLPQNMVPGRHMLVWVWYYKNAPQWSTCFDVMIQGNPQAPIPAPAPPPAPPAPPALDIPESVVAAAQPEVPEKETMEAILQRRHARDFTG